ncbi:MAG: Delta-aminolevulinic acid dehydratase [Alphaproteobacteria bacterium MarineAlpha9_Bin4]|nr:porphobilinogen synthase [Pelagibacterales bacterium]PPR26992.1 MAG: Delta-aminolevulinic acid dehydratase [Alphaproteobacteria bacterium MarineAlpha9_Bin4]
MNNYLSNFPLHRPRRLRSSKWIRKLVQETKLLTEDLIFPIFVTYERKSSKIKSMPGICRYNIEEALDLAHKAKELGINAVALFPQVSQDIKDDKGSEAFKKDNIICKLVEKIKKTIPSLGVICDVALDPYTKSGHDGLVENGKVINDKTLDLLCEQALINAQAGCDIVAPSDMMDGRVQKIRNYLDKNNKEETLIMSYAVKYSSSMYGPFREAISASLNLGEDKKKSYQMDYANINEALKEASMDIKEGADILLIKPGIMYLDVLKEIKKKFKYPTFSYQVSGEYSMLKNAILSGTFKEEEVLLEILSCFKRAGADSIITYFALDVANILKKGA